MIVLKQLNLQEEVNWKKKNLDSKLVISNKSFCSRLIIGTGKYTNYEINKKALEASGAEMVTVAMRRVNLSNNLEPKLTDYISPKNILFFLILLDVLTLKMQ